MFHVHTRCATPAKDESSSFQIGSGGTEVHWLKLVYAFIVLKLQRKVSKSAQAKLRSNRRKENTKLPLPTKTATQSLFIIYWRHSSHNVLFPSLTWTLQQSWARCQASSACCSPSLPSRLRSRTTP